MRMTGSAARLLVAAITLGASPSQGFAQQPEASPPAQAPASIPAPPPPAATQHAHEHEDKTAIPVATLVAAALEANPELAAMRREFDASRARVPQEKALPDPELMFGNMTQHNPIPFAGLSGDFSEIYVGVSQEVPWFGVRRLRGEAAASESEAKLRAYETRARSLAAEVKTAAVELYALDRKIAVVARDQEIIANFVRVAQARYEVGKAEQADIINAQLQGTELVDMKGALEARRASAETTLNTLLDRDPETRIGAIARPAYSATIPALDELLAFAREKAPELAEKRRLVDAESHRLRLAEIEAKYPSVSFQFTYHNRPAFEDYYTYGVSLRLPFWSASKQRYGVAEKTETLAASRSNLAWAEAQVRGRLRDAHVRSTTAARLLRLHEEGLVPQSALALESSMAAYQVGRVDFLTLLNALKKALDYETHYYDLLAEYYTALAEIEALTGAELMR